MNGTRKRKSASQTREAMLEFGVRLISSDGLRPSLDGLSLDSCLDELDIARSSAYNAWSSADNEMMPQLRYQRAVLKRFVLETPQSDHEEAFAFAKQLVAEDETIRTREDLRREMNRVGAAQHFKNVAEDRGLRVRTALMFAATTAPGDEADEEMLGWFRQAGQVRRQHMVESGLRPLTQICGIRPRRSLDGPDFWEQLSIAMSALGNGLSPHVLVSTDVELHVIPVVGHGGVQRPWTLMAIGLNALIEAFFENDPDSEVALPSETDEA